MPLWAVGAVAVQAAAFDVGVNAGCAVLVALSAGGLHLGAVRLMALEAVLVVLRCSSGRDFVAACTGRPLRGGVRLVAVDAPLVGLGHDPSLGLVALSARAPLHGAVRLVTAGAILVTLAYDLRLVLVAEPTLDLVALWLVRDRASVTSETVLVSFARLDRLGVSKRVRGVTAATESCLAGPEIELMRLVAVAADRPLVIRPLVEARV